MKNLFLFLVVAFLSNVSMAQTQLGADIDGKSIDELCGTSVSLSADGRILAVGAPYSEGNGDKRGHVRVYNYTSGSWAQLGADIIGEEGFDWSGCFVSISADGNILAIGAPYNDGNAYDAGHVRIYKYTSGTWTQLGTDIDGVAENDYSGIVSISADGSIVAIGAPYSDEKAPDAGVVKIYKYEGGTWTQMGTDIYGESESDKSGNSVSLSADGSIVAIGAPNNDPLNSGIASQAGHVRVYKYVAGSWTQLGSDIDGVASDRGSGYSISLSAEGNIVAIGIQFSNGPKSYDDQYVRVYKYISGVWTKLGKDIYGEDSLDWNGISISLSADGSLLAIGGPANDGNGELSGHVRIYNYDGGEWTQLGSDIDGENAGDNCGSSVSMSADGKTVAVGAPNHFVTGEGNDAGQVRVYSLSSLLSTNQVREIKTIGIYPNPASKEIKITADANLIGNTYKILNSTGQEVLNGTITEKSTRIDLGNLSAGYYLLSVGENNIQTHKLVIE